MVIKKAYIALGCIVIALIGILVWVNISRSMGIMHYKPPKLEEVTQEEIDKIEIKKVGNSITLSKDNNEQWRIIPQNYLVDSNKTKNMLRELALLKITDLISDKGYYERYQLDDDKKIEIIAYSGEKLVRELSAGKLSSRSSHTYITLKDNPNIYQVKGNLKTNFDYEINELRDKKVCSFDKSEITEVLLEYGKEKIQIIKKVDEKDTSDTEGPEATPTKVESWSVKGEVVNKSAIDSIINNMYNLYCKSFIEDKQKSDFSDGFIRRITAKGTKDYTVTIWDKNADNEYPAISSESEYPYMLADWKAKNFLKTMEDLEKKDED